MAVTFTEWTGSPRFSGTRKDQTGTREGEIAWADIAAYILELFPADIGGIPQLPALFPGTSGLYADSYSFEPLWSEDAIVSSTPPNVYNQAHAIIQYKTLPWEQEDPGDQIISRRVTVGSQLMTIPNFALKWHGTEDKITAPEAKGGVLQGTINHELTFQQVSSIPWVAIRQLIGTVNDGAWEGAAAECLLFLGVSVTQTVYENDLKYSASCRFSERNVNGDTSLGWNHLFDPFSTPPAWRKVVIVESGNTMYPLGDFDNLL